MNKTNDFQTGNAEMEQRIEELMDALRLANHKRFGASSEKIEESLVEQLSFLFNKAEVFAAAPRRKNPPRSPHTSDARRIMTTPWITSRRNARQRKEGSDTMKLIKHGVFLVNFVIDFTNCDMSRRDFDLDYSGYVIEHFPEFLRARPRLSRKFAETIKHTYSACSWMPDDRFQDAISDALDEFLGTASKVDIY